MEGLEELIEKGLDALSDLFSSSSDIDDGDIGNLMEAITNGDFVSEGITSFTGNEIDSFSESMENAMNSALEDLSSEIGDNSDISFMGLDDMSHHVPESNIEINDPLVLHSTDRDLSDNHEISFMGSDKYTDNEWNEAAAKKQLEQEEYLRNKGDNKAADAAHGQAKDHLRRITKK